MIGPAIGLLGAGAVDRAWSPGNKTTAKKQTIKTLRTMLGPACRFMVVVRNIFWFIVGAKPDAVLHVIGRDDLRLEFPMAEFAAKRLLDGCRTDRRKRLVNARRPYGRIPSLPSDGNPFRRDPGAVKNRITG
jgi:hypothetical protein